MTTAQSTQNIPARTDRLALHAIVVPALALCLASPALAAGIRPAVRQPADSPCANSLAIGEVGLSMGGQVRLLTNGSNFRFHQRVVPDDADADSFANTRFRTWLNLHDNRDCRYGIYVQAEVGQETLGVEFEFPKTTGVELRRGYLWFKPTDYSLIRAGVLDWQDRFGERSTFTDPLWAVDRYDSTTAPLANSVWNFNVGGVVVEATARDAWHYSFGALLLEPGFRTITGDGSALLFTADVDNEVGSSQWGAGLYYLLDRGSYSYRGFGGPPTVLFDGDNWDLWAGVRGHFMIGPTDTSVFLILNRGEVERPAWEHTGWAAKAATAVPIGNGSLRLQALYSTGSDGSDPTESGEFRTIAQSVGDNFGAQSYWSPLGLTSPRGPSDVTDLGIGLQNRGLEARPETPLLSRQHH